VDVAGGYSNQDTFQNHVKILRNCLVTTDTGSFQAPNKRQQAPEAAVPHKLSQRLSQETIRQIVTRYEAGEPSTALTKEFGIGKGSVLKVLREAGVTMRNQGLSNEQIDDAQRLYESGQSLGRIGEKFGVDHTVVRRQLIRRGVWMRDRHGRPK
jgi:DNA invertase Pin-like site-specific DNA recombinase